MIARGDEWFAHLMSVFLLYILLDKRLRPMMDSVNRWISYFNFEHSHSPNTILTLKLAHCLVLALIRSIQNIAPMAQPQPQPGARIELQVGDRRSTSFASTVIEESTYFASLLSAA